MSIVLIALVHLLQILLSLLNSVVIPLQYLCVQNELSLHIRVQCIVCFPAISRIRPNPLDVLNISAVICNETRLLNVFVYSITSFVTLSSTRKAHHSIIFIFERLPFFSSIHSPCFVAFHSSTSVTFSFTLLQSASISLSTCIHSSVRY